MKPGDLARIKMFSTKGPVVIWKSSLRGGVKDRAFVMSKDQVALILMVVPKDDLYVEEVMVLVGDKYGWTYPSELEVIP